jgi:ribosomal protein L19E
VAIFSDLLKHKAQPEAAANGVEAWVKSEREMRERLKKEKEARELREKAMVCLWPSIFWVSSRCFVF